LLLSSLRFSTDHFGYDECPCSSRHRRRVRLRSGDVNKEVAEIFGINPPDHPSEHDEGQDPTMWWQMLWDSESHRAGSSASFCARVWPMPRLDKVSPDSAGLALDARVRQKKQPAMPASRSGSDRSVNLIRSTPLESRQRPELLSDRYPLWGFRSARA
jgi:hypothetical protein